MLTFVIYRCTHLDPLSTMRKFGSWARCEWQLPNKKLCKGKISRFIQQFQGTATTSKTRVTGPTSVTELALVRASFSTGTDYVLTVLVKLAYLARLLKSRLQVSSAVSVCHMTLRCTSWRSLESTPNHAPLFQLRWPHSHIEIGLQCEQNQDMEKCKCKGSVIRCNYPENMQIQISGINLNLKNIFPQVLSALDILQPPHIDYFEEMYPLPFTDSKMDSGIPVLICCTIIPNLKPQLLRLFQSPFLMLERVVWKNKS